MATFQGAPYLREQIDSLLRQEDSDWLLLVRDDGSRDATRDILADAATKDSRIRVIDDELGRLGSARSFLTLMQHAQACGARTFALCDQDDVWHPARLARQRRRLAELSDAAGEGVPLLTYSDISWIGADGRLLAESHFHRAGLDAARHGPGHWLFAMNAVPGCAVGGNRALLDLALPAPPTVRHHDWWLLLVAAACGEVGVIDEALVGYRQHGANLIGAAALQQRIVAALGAPRDALASGRRVYWQGVDLARVLEERAGDAMHPQWRATCRHVIEELGAASPSRRVLASLRGPVRRIGLWRNLLMLSAAVSARPPKSLLE